MTVLQRSAPERAAPDRTDPAPGLLRRVTVRGAMKAALAAQVALAVLLVWTDIAGRPLTGADPIAPRVQEPFSPGDQTRPWSPSDVPRRPGDDAPDIPLPPPDDGLQFRMTQAGAVLQVAGAFRPGDDARFERFLDALPAQPETVAFHSPGGSVDAALAIGRAIRDRGMDTMVQAGRACASACPTAFGGGVNRLASRTAWIGVHQTFFTTAGVMSPNRAAYEIQILKAEMMRFWQDMGVDPAIEALAMQTPADRIYYLVEDELTALRLATKLIE